MSRTVVRAGAFLLAISLALMSTRAFSDDPPKKPAKPRSLTGRVVAPHCFNGLDAPCAYGRAWHGY